MTNQEIIDSGIVHFKLGEDFGKLITTISQEHIQYNYDIKKGLETITESLPGVPFDLVLKVIKGEYVIVVSDDQINVNIVKRTQEHDHYPEFNIFEWCKKKYKEINNNGKDIKYLLKSVSSTFRYRTNVNLSIPVSSLKSLFSGNLNGDEALEYILSDEGVKRTSDIIRISKEFCSTSLRIHQVILSLMTLYKDYFSFDEINIIELWRSHALDTLEELNKIIESLSDLKFSNEDDDDLNDYLESSKEIGDILRNGIKPVDILNNYSAGWLSPDGIFYGLNGSVSNMIHNQIADALLNTGVIPESNDPGYHNPDRWLEMNGWVRIHGNSIVFDGCKNEDGKKIFLTDNQVNIIKDYIDICHGGKLTIGWRKEIVSSNKFLSMFIGNKIGLHDRYFNY